MSCIICHKEANHSCQLREFCNEHYDMVKSIDSSSLLAQAIDFLKDTCSNTKHINISTIYY